MLELASHNKLSLSLRSRYARSGAYKIILAYLMVGCFVLSVPADATETALQLRRGINVHPWFTRPVDVRPNGEVTTLFPNVPKDSYRSELAKLRKSGFDFIRVPVASEPLRSAAPSLRDASLNDVRRVIREAIDQGFSILFDLHAQPAGAGSLQNMLQDVSVRDSYLALLDEAVKKIFSIDKSKIIVETMNEPTTSCEDARWQTLQMMIFTRLRQRFQNINVALTGACLSGHDALKFVDTKAFMPMANTYYTFHYYRPFWFTHQGATWSGGPGVEILTGVPWPPSSGSPAQTIEQIERAAPSSSAYKKAGERAVTDARNIVKRYFEWNPDRSMVSKEIADVGIWADLHGVDRKHVILGEFGVLKRERRWNGADMGSAARWIEAVRTIAEKENFPWAMWSYKDGMALTLSDENFDYHPEIIHALGLKQ